MTELFDAILKASVQGSIVILAVLALRLLLKKAPKTVICLLWLLAGLRLVMLFEIPSPFSLQPRLEDTTISIQAQQPAQEIVVQNPVGQPLETPAEPVQTPDLPEGNRENLRTESFLYGVENGVITGPIDLGNIAAWVWLLGAAALLTASAFSYIRLKRRVREAYLIENGCFECPGLDTAFVLGFFPPRIYLPMGLSEEEKKFVFDHENTHIARHDHWFKVLGYGILSLHWFNPLVWLGYSLLCRDMELACDEHVVKYMTLPQRKAYSAALLSCGGHTARIAACPVAFGESNPKKRILNVLNYKRPSFWIILLAVAAVIFVSVCLLTSPEKQVEEPEETMKWNLEMQVTDVTPSGLRAEFIQHGVINPRDGGELMFGSEYALEKWVDGSWEPVEMLPQEYDVAWTMEAYLIGQNSTTPFQVEWEWLYGQLPPGQYRIGKGVTLRYYLLGDTEHETFYGTFTIEESEPQDSVWSADMTDEEYLTLCRNAVEELQSRNQFHISETLGYFTGETEDSRNYVVFWKDGENWLRESYITRMKVNADYFYYGGTMYLRKQEESGEVTWNRIDGGGAGYGDPWLCMLQWDEQDVTFEGTAVEDDEFRVNVIVQGAPPTIGWDDVQEYQVLFCFDQQGNLFKAILGACRDSLRVVSDLTIENTLASKIRNKLENVAAQRPDAPELHQSLTEEQWLEKCRSALEAYQAQGSWVVLVNNQFSGETVTEETSSELWYIHGDDWVKHVIVSNSDYHQEKWILKKDSKCYFREGYTVYGSVNGENFVGDWQESVGTALPIPWTLEFDLSSEDITFIEARTDGDSFVVTFRVAGDFNHTRYEKVEEHYVSCWLRPSGEMWQMELNYTTVDSKGLKTYVCTTIEHNAAAPEEAEKAIQQRYSEALLHVHGICNDPNCTDSTHDHSGVNCTDANCTNATHHHSNHHSDDHHH